MPSQDMHALVLQLSEIATKYEQYWQEIEALAKKYEGTPKWAENVLGELTPHVRASFANIDDMKKDYVASVQAVRNLLLDTAQAIMKHT